jgi:hypothetical protein
LVVSKITIERVKKAKSLYLVGNGMVGALGQFAAKQLNAIAGEYEHQYDQKN